MRKEIRPRVIQEEWIIFADGLDTTIYAGRISRFLEICEDRFEETVGKDAKNWTEDFLYAFSYDEEEKKLFKVLFDRNVLRHNLCYADHENKFILGDAYFAFKREFFELMESINGPPA